MAVEMPPLAYRALPDWEQLPAGHEHLDVAAVSVDARDRVYLLTRNPARVFVYEMDGSFVRTWGEGLFTNRAHGITVAADGGVYCIDDADHTVRKFSAEGELLQTIGTSGQPSETGYDGSTVASIQVGGPPFNRPTNLAIATGGDLFVTDGYGNARVHRFAPDGRLLASWGEPGSGPGQFMLPHGIVVDSQDRVLVCDRENDRIQLFDLEGRYLEEWLGVQRPTHACVGPDGLIYVSELWWKPGQVSFRTGAHPKGSPPRVSILTPNGQVVARIGGESVGCEPGQFVAPHGIAVDSGGDIYVAEVCWTFAGSVGLAPRDCHSLQKLTRVG